MIDEHTRLALFVTQHCVRPSLTPDSECCALPMMRLPQPDTQERKRLAVQAIPFALPPAPEDKALSSLEVTGGYKGRGTADVR